MEILLAIVVAIWAAVAVDHYHSEVSNFQEFDGVKHRKMPPLDKFWLLVEAIFWPIFSIIVLARLRK